jgi:hypothetical protein
VLILLLLLLLLLLLMEMMMMVLLLLLMGSIAGGAYALTRRGLAVKETFCEDMASLAPGTMNYFYSWNLNPAEGWENCFDFVNKTYMFVPMVWGRGSLSSIASIYPEFEYLYTFNEPNHSGQSNITPGEAASYWPIIEDAARNNSALIGAPTVGPCNSGPPKCVNTHTGWLDEFFTLCNNCKVDFLNVHYFTCKPENMITFLNDMRRYQLPIVISEFNCGGGSEVTNPNSHYDYMRQILPILDSDPDVLSYSWMSARNTHNTAAALVDSLGVPTDLGVFYRDSPIFNE